jgi:hypothetical protein
VALFNDLHDVAQVLAEHIREEAGIEDVQPGPPRDVAATTVAGVRLSFLYATPEPSHQNDAVERQPDGSRRFPPLSLSCFYVVTASGADADDPIAGHSALGRVMSLYHDQPTLRLPLSENPGADPGAFSDLGEGNLDVIQVPILPDQVDKIWTSFQLAVQPWALLEVGPVQLISPREDLGPAPLVAPGGIGLEVRAGIRPVVVRITPEAVRTEGRVRIDASVPGGLDAVVVDGIVAAAGDAVLTASDDGSSMLLDLEDGGFEDLEPGTYPLTVRSGGFVSRRALLRIAEPEMPVIDAPLALLHDPDDDLVLSGANLGDAEECLVWPDGGVAAPSEVHSLALTAGTAASVTVASAELDVLGGGGRTWRLAIRVGERVFTPYVLLELAS